ncbi:MAG: phosphoenolpyruvate--protein phosphotransferase [Elusimicrobia bacterium]|nr:phosphoenolpyruvate--protein phosphotransferase [Elusimicrobiota bacterium]
MKILKGKSAANGIAQGIVFVYSVRDLSLDRGQYHTITPEQIPDEIGRLEEGFDRAKNTLTKMIDIGKESLDRNNLNIFNFHLELLKDKALYEKSIQRIKEQNVNAQHAIRETFEEYIKSFKQKELHFSDLINDFVDIRNRILESFGKLSGRLQFPVGKEGPFIVASKLLIPSMLLEISRENVLAFITNEGSLTSHATILARSYRVPIVFGIDVEKHLKTGDDVIVDGFSEEIVVNPDQRTKDFYSRKIEQVAKKEIIIDTTKDQAAMTKDGQRITLKININSLDEVNYIKQLNHDGIGLLRTEFLFMGRTESPTEEEQFNIYKQILECSDGTSVTVRLLDLDTGKLPAYLTVPGHYSIDLGLRGSHAVDVFYDTYLTQAKALLRASMYGNLKILYPMVSDNNDLQIFRRLISNAKNILKKKKVKFDTKVSEGIMIETPSAAISAQELLSEVGFANIGTNDLLQYILAVSRDISIIEERYHILHPSLVKFLELIVRAGKKLNKEVCLCGAIASYEPFYHLFLELGFKSFSIPVFNFNNIKYCINQISPSKTGVLLTKFFTNKNKKQLDKFFAQLS